MLIWLQLPNAEQCHNRRQRPALPTLHPSVQTWLAAPKCVSSLPSTLPFHLAPLQNVLAAPLGMVRLMGMLTEREALRNEGLLLMQQLVLGHAEVQKIAAFEGAFDRALSIVR